jgi:hypothetical protein
MKKSKEKSSAKKAGAIAKEDIQKVKEVIKEIMYLKI